MFTDTVLSYAKKTAMRITVFVCIVVLAGVCAPCGAATIIVDPSGGGDFIEIQPAIDAAQNGDTVLVKPGEYVITESIDFNRLHESADPNAPPAKNITLLTADVLILAITAYLLIAGARETVRFFARRTRAAA